MTRLLSLSARALQRLIALPFVVLGGWALAWPWSVQLIALRAEMRADTPLQNLLIACFGAQALLCALFILTSRFSRWSFALFALALLPLFWFDWHFYVAQPIFSAGIALDLLGNLVMLGLCGLGWRAARAEGL